MSNVLTFNTKAEAQQHLRQAGLQRFVRRPAYWGPADGYVLAHGEASPPIFRVRRFQHRWAIHAEFGYYDGTWNAPRPGLLRGDGLEYEEYGHYDPDNTLSLDMGFYIAHASDSSHWEALILGRGKTPAAARRDAIQYLREEGCYERDRDVPFEQSTKRMVELMEIYGVPATWSGTMDDIMGDTSLDVDQYCTVTAINGQCTITNEVFIT